MLFCDNCIPHGQVTLTQQPDEVASIPTPTISLGVTYTYDISRRNFCGGTYLRVR